MNSADRDGGEPVARIGLRVISSAGWQGGVNYVINWARMCAAAPEEERPEIRLLWFDDRGREIAESLAHLVAGIHPFVEASALDLDMVYPSTQIFEAPFDAPWAAWIPDWQCKHLPELFDPVEYGRRDLHYGILATRAPYLALSSKMAIEDSVKLFGERLVAHGQLPFAAVLDEALLERAARDIPRVRAEHGLSARYFLVANQWWRHKNHAIVLKALSLIHDKSVQVVCTGATRDHRWPDYPANLLTDYPATDRLKILGSVDRQAQLALMMGAVAVIQPSRFEGWSTVVEESRALNVPLLLSSIPVHVEQAPDRAAYFGVDDAEELARLMAALWARPSAHKRSNDTGVIERRCVQHLVAAANATKRNYDAKRHDPAIILAEMAVRFAGPRLSEVETALAAKFFSGARAMLSTNAAAIDRFRSAIASLAPQARAILEKQVATPAAAKAAIARPG